MRKLICFLVASGMTASGAYLAYMQVFVATQSLGKLSLLGAGLFGIGITWLVSDFILRE